MVRAGSAPVQLAARQVGVRAPAGAAVLVNNCRGFFFPLLGRGLILLPAHLEIPKLVQQLSSVD